MYIDRRNKPKKIFAKTIRKAMVKRIEYYNKNNSKKIQMDESDLDYASESLAELNKAILTGNDVWGECVKEPRGNLDTGRHYFRINYCKVENKKAVFAKLWVYDFIRALGGYNQNRDYNMDKFVFGSGAIGMSRKLDATDGVFTFLKKCGGTYVQL